jgi:hypothetical protein
MEWNRFRTNLIDSGDYIQDREDDLIWTGGDNSGLITVKNIYHANLTTQGLKKVLGWRQAILKWNLQLKIKCFIWLAAKNKILTWENMNARGWEGSSRCYLYMQEIENTNHLFIHCAFTKSVWDRLALLLNFKMCWKGNNLNDCMNSWVSDKSVPTLVAVHTCWFIWIERNLSIFEEKIPSLHSVIPKILGLHNNGLKVS